MPTMVILLLMRCGSIMGVGYEKVFLKKGEKKRVAVVLDEDAFSFYDMNQHRFVVEKGDFEILVGPASSQLPLKATVEL